MAELIERDGKKYILEDGYEWEYTPAEPEPPQPESDKQKIAKLEADKVVMQQQLAQINANFAGFTDQYYIDFPEKA